MVSFPVEPMLAEATSTLPLPDSMPGGCWYEPKFDGFRALVHRDGDARVQSRRGSDLTAAFPDIAAGVNGQLPPGTVLDGELMVWSGQAPDFSALQRRLARRRNAALLATVEPATLLAFDVLAANGTDVRARPLRERRRILEELGEGMRPPLQVVPGTDNLDQARRWVEDYSRVEVGVEGLVVKGLATPYTPGRRGWLKYKLRDTAEAVVGAVIGTPENAERLVLGHFDGRGQLRIVASTHVLAPRHRSELREHLVTAVAEHPWPAEIRAGGLGRWGGRDLVAIHRVQPSVVVEISADRAFDRGRWRHLARYVRLRLDLQARQVLAHPDR